MKGRLIKKINGEHVSRYLIANKDRSIQDVFDEIKNKKFKERSIEEGLVYSYILANKRKLGVK